MATTPPRITNDLNGTGTQRDGRSLMEAAGASITLEWLDDRLAVGDCPFLGCEDPVGSFRVFKNPRSEETFECGSCQRAGDLRDLEGLMSSPDGADLLDRLAGFMQRYVVLSGVQAYLLALWVVHTHAFDAADTTPYLEIVSAEKRSGKTRLLETLEPVVARPWFASRVTSAVLARKIQAERPTLLLDESDAAFKADKEYSETLRGILNAGFRLGGAVSLCIGQGASITYGDFAVFSPKAIAGIGKLPDTISDRCIRIELKRRARSERVERFRLREVRPEAERLRTDAETWAQAHIPTLTEMEPDLPEELDDRAQDIVEPLLAIADAVGGEWPERARRAVVALAGASVREDSESLGVRLLRDIREVFDGEGKDRLSTSTILEKLHEADEAPWGSLRGEPLDARGLARLLKPYGIRPKQIREGEQTHKGYKREDFEDAWSRYLDEAHVDTSYTPPAKRNSETDHSNPAYRAENGVSEGVSGADSVSDAEHEKRHRNGDVSDVSDNPGEDEEMRRTGIIQSERQVFEMAREHFGLDNPEGVA